MDSLIDSGPRSICGNKYNYKDYLCHTSALLSKIANGLNCLILEVASVSQSIYKMEELRDYLHGINFHTGLLSQIVYLYR